MDRFDSREKKTPAKAAPKKAAAKKTKVDPEQQVSNLSAQDLKLSLSDRSVKYSITEQDKANVENQVDQTQVSLEGFETTQEQGIQQVPTEEQVTKGEDIQTKKKETKVKDEAPEEEFGELEDKPVDEDYTLEKMVKEFSKESEGTYTIDELSHIDQMVRAHAKQKQTGEVVNPENPTREFFIEDLIDRYNRSSCLLYTSPSPRDS